jgi:hypothetical protein
MRSAIAGMKIHLTLAAPPGLAQDEIVPDGRDILQRMIEIPGHVDITDHVCHSTLLYDISILSAKGKIFPACLTPHMVQEIDAIS